MILKLLVISEAINLADKVAGGLELQFHVYSCLWCNPTTLHSPSLEDKGTPVLIALLYPRVLLFMRLTTHLRGLAKQSQIPYITPQGTSSDHYRALKT